MSALLQQIIQLLTGGITSIASAIGSGIGSLFTNIFLTGSGTQADPYTLSVAGGIICIFAGIGFCIGLSKLCTRYLFSLGGSDM